MMVNFLQDQHFFEKICAIPAEKVAKIVDVLRHRENDRRLVEGASRLSEDALRIVWDNAEDADYDRL